MTNIQLVDIFDSGCEMIVIPISTNATVSYSFASGIEKNGLNIYFRKNRYILGEIEVHKISNHTSIKYIVLACCVGRNSSDYLTLSKVALKIAFATRRLRSIKNIGIPLLGTGAGNLDFTMSLETLFRNFYENSRKEIDLCFCCIKKEVFETLKKQYISESGVSVLRVRQLILENYKSKSIKLDLGYCGIENLHLLPELFKCSHLEELVLSNEWGEYTSRKWVKKKSANKGVANRINNLPMEIGFLVNLRILICGGDWKKPHSNGNIEKWGITDISIISKLKNLEILNVSNNAVNNVGQIYKLRNLRYLYLNNNEIDFFPDISNLKLLTNIYLSNNKLSSVDFLKNTKSLRTVDLHSNRISDLSPIKKLISKIGIVDSKWTVNRISIASNPLETPRPEIISQGKEKVIAYFRQLEAEQGIDIPPYVNKDIKLILVGNSNVGKSTLFDWMKTKEIKRNIPTTHWMICEKWQAKYKGKEYTIRVFDFGGQEYYHDTHHLFFTNNTAYLLLWDRKSNKFDEIEVDQIQQNGFSRKETIQTFPLTYWLDSINLHTSKRAKSADEIGVEKLVLAEDELTNNITPQESENLEKLVYTNENILVAQNKVDTIKDKSFIDEKGLKDSYPKIFDLLDISVWEKRGLVTFEEKLFQLIDYTQVIGKVYLGTWGRIKDEIESNYFKDPLSLTEFKELCNSIISNIPQIKGKSNDRIKGVLFSNQDAQSFAQFLNDIGLLLYFPENKKLNDIVFINQSEVLKSIYEVLKGLETTQGVLDLNKLAIQQGKTVIDIELRNTINLMLHFKIIFEHPTKINTYIAPLYLPNEPIHSIKIFIPLFHKPIYRYDCKNFIYKNVILDFFNSYGKKALKESDSEDQYYYWKDGIVIRDEQTQEIVMVKFIPAKMDSQIAHIDVYKINGVESDEFLNQIVSHLDSINDGFDVTKTVCGQGNDFIPVSEIHKNEENENWIFQYRKKYYNLIDFRKYFQKPIKMKKIFISYSKQDFALVTKFLDHLSALKLDGKVSDWYCSELLAGTEWDQTIQQHFDESNIICFMISSNFMKTKYIHEHEIANAFKRRNRDANFKIVPIILDFCKWNTSKNDLSVFTALPYTAKPVADFNNQNMAWYIVQECLRIMIDEDLNPTGENFYTSRLLPTDVQKIFKRIVEDKVDNNSL